jgi:hypothetical protein
MSAAAARPGQTQADEQRGTCLIAASHLPSTPHRPHASLPVDDRLQPLNHNTTPQLQRATAVTAMVPGWFATVA